ncbi:hypothetical protein [Halobacillus litoralis]|uniref:Uncharacterized protein n=1 Tax=Halobacillus litoralis TaxID=45668 RepID=A0A410ME96_9BACI|nr:hypothetical protein [Halobacillus litoralis]QAS52946.1 hypothetical protein HLI_12455 [Halobacillus litoralis]
MSSISWFDWITPTNPVASLFFGILFTIIIGITVWVEARDLKTVVVTTITGIIVTCVGTAILNVIGFYP